MAPKRQRGESSSGSHAYDKRRFTSFEASEHYHNYLDGKKLIPERGLNPGVLDGHLFRNLQERRWVLLRKQPNPAIISVVKEFYANAVDAKHCVVKVRGKNVSYKADNINRFFNLPTTDDEDDYSTYKKQTFNPDEIVNSLCQPGTTWFIKNGEPRHFSYTGLSKYGKAWYYFLCAKLMPTTHVTEVIKERATLLYCLAKNKSINIGKVIQGSIQQTIEGGSTRGLPHPSLICGLCEAADVVWDENEPTQEPQVVIDSRIIRNFKQWEGAPPEPLGAGFVLDPQSPDSDELTAANQANEGTSSSQAVGDMILTMQRCLDRQNL